MEDGGDGTLKREQKGAPGYDFYNIFSKKVVKSRKILSATGPRHNPFFFLAL